MKNLKIILQLKRLGLFLIKRIKIKIIVLIITF